MVKKLLNQNVLWCDYIADIQQSKAFQRMCRLPGKTFWRMVVVWLFQVPVLCGPGWAADTLGRFEAGQPIILPLDVGTIEGEVWIEIDAVDVTEFASVSDDRLVVDPPMPFDGTEHELVVYLWDGSDPVVLARYTFSSSAGSTAWTTSINALHEAGVRRLNGDGTSHAVSSGELGVENAGGTVEAGVSYLATSRDADQINGNPVDIGEYFVRVQRPGDTMDLAARIGTQTVSRDRALISDVTRRGLSVGLSRPDQRLAFGAFSLRSEEQAGADNLFGVSDSRDRFQGGYVALRPFGDNDLRVSLQAYGGRATPYGGLVTGSGDGVSVALDGTLRDGRLRYDLALGSTDWDEDGGGGGFAPLSAEAFLAGLSYDLLKPESGRSLTVGFGYERVEQFYFSLANPGLPTGGETFRLTGDYAADRLALSLYAETQETNVGGLPEWQTDRIDQAGLDGNWALRGSGWMADASLRFGAAVATQSRLRTPMQAPPAEDFTLWSGYVGLERAGERVSWAVDYAHLDFNDQSAGNIDERSHAFDLWVGYSPGDRLDIWARANAVLTDDAFGNWSRGELSLGGHYAVVPDSWIVSGDFGLTATDQPGVSDGYFSAADVTWRIHPAIDLVLGAAHRHGAYAGESGQKNDTIVTVLVRATTSRVR